MPEEVREFHIAVMRNDIAKVQELVDAGIDVNYPWMNAESPSIKDGSTPLCEAVSLNHHSIVQKLIDSGAIVNKPDYFGCTPLHKSSYHGRATLTAVLINAGAEVKLYDHNLNTPLQVCTQSSVVHNNVDTARVLIEAGADVNAPNRFGKIALHYAAIWGLGEMTDVLIKANSSIDYIDLKRKTPLYCCIRSINVFDREQELFEQYLPSAKGNSSMNQADLKMGFPMYCCIRQVSGIDREQELFQQRLPAIKVLIMSGCDPLNLATWLYKHSILSEMFHMDEEFYSWYSSSRPESLKHLCREAVQRHFNDDTIKNVKLLPLPTTIIEYLMRRLL
ncbi:serine/threonine-protein phosphatase 6 regulatory ankyrin repeat subunit C-like isoform X2 [Stegodyphus dumicola]|nr:serine/threonine-protein phosphatase 6 regulatory ankyrin repeat subunit C-like isoform X2 [Stegodyphus dumicola]